MMPIADDAFGNSVLIQTDGSDVGSVWFWDHEDPDNLLPIADDFDSFFAGLEEPDLD